MSRVIKAADRPCAVSVERFLGKPIVPKDRGAASEMQSVTDPLAAENKRLKALLEERDAAISTHADALVAAYAEGEAAGRIAAESEAVQDRTAALDALRAGLTEARNAFASSFASTESLAALIAREALEKLLGDRTGDTRQHLVMDLIAHQFARLSKGSLVGAEVSRLDFPDTSEVARLAAELGLPEDMLRVSSERESGDCVIRLRLGEIDIGLDRQWSVIRQALSDMARNDEALA